MKCWRKAKWGVIERVSAHKTEIYVFTTGRVTRLEHGLDWVEMFVIVQNLNGRL